MEQSPPWEANSHSANQEILHLLWCPKINLRIHNSPPLVPNLSQMNPMQTFPPYFLKIHSNTILHLRLDRPSGGFLLPGLPDQNFVCISNLYRACNIPSPSHPPWIDRTNHIRSGVQTNFPPILHRNAIWEIRKWLQKDFLFIGSMARHL
jgi:hypothetical protein